MNLTNETFLCGNCDKDDTFHSVQKTCLQEYVVLMEKVARQQTVLFTGYRGIIEIIKYLLDVADWSILKVYKAF
jgi:hypothetical protein